MDKYDKVGGGQFGVYRKRESSFGETLGGIVLLVIAGLILFAWLA